MVICVQGALESSCFVTDLLVTTYKTAEWPCYAFVI